MAIERVCITLWISSPWPTPRHHQPAEEEAVEAGRMNSEAADRMEEDYWGLSIKNGITGQESGNTLR